MDDTGGTVRIEPTAELDERFSAPGARATPWSEARDRLRAADVHWLTTVRPDGRPHVTPLLAVWEDEALYFCTGPGEQKARNLRLHAECVLTTGCNVLDQGVDLVVEGRAVRVGDDGRLRQLAAAWEAKYGPDWRFTVRDGAFHGEGGAALVFAVAPRTVFAFAKGDYAQTRYLFAPR